MKRNNANTLRLVLLTLLLAGAFLLAGCGGGSQDGQSGQAGKDLSPYAGKTTADLSGYEGVADSGEPARMVETNVAEAVSYMNNKETFALLLGYEDCDWCQLIFPYVNEAAAEAGQTMGYIDTRKDPSWMNNMDIDDYDLFVEYFGEYLEDDEDGKPHLYTPDLYFIRNGQIVARYDGTVEGMEDPEREMSGSQKEKVKKALADGFAAMTGK